MLACALGVFVGPEAEVEFQLDQVGNVVVLGVGRGGCRGHDEVKDSHGGGFFMLEMGILDPVGFELPGEALVETGVIL